MSDDGVVIFLSSISTGGAYHGLGAYAREQGRARPHGAGLAGRAPECRFVRMAVGDTIDTDFSRDFDMERAGTLMPKWVAASVIYKNHMRSADLGRTIAEFVAMMLAHPEITIPEITLIPAGPMMSMEDVQELMATLADGIAASS